MDPVRARALRDMGFTVWARRDASAPEETFAAETVPGSDAPMPEEVSVTPPSLTATPAILAGRAQDLSDWERLEAEVAVCTRCPLARGRTRTVFGVGARDARWMLIGEGPGAEEDKRGEPFVGRAGKLLDAMLAALAVKREQVYIANVVKCRPPGNRNPEPAEAEACWPYLERQIAWVDPALIIALGAVAVRRLLGVETPVGRLRGRVHEGPNGRPVVVTYHPAYLLRNPAGKRKSWEDLRLALATAAPRVP